MVIGWGDRKESRVLEKNATRRVFDPRFVSPCVMLSLEYEMRG